MAARDAKRGRWSEFLPVKDPECEGGAMVTRLNIPLFGNVSTVTANMGAVQCVNAVILGPGQWNRRGKSIRMKRLCFKISVVVFQFGLINPGYASIMIVYDRQTNQQTPDLVDFLYEYTNLGQKRTAASTMIAKEMRKRFVCLWRHDFMVPPTTSGAPIDEMDGQNQWMLHVADIDLMGLETVFDEEAPFLPGADDAQQINTGGLFVCFPSNALITGLPPLIPTQAYYASGDIILEWDDVCE